jgi:hypothetical protein
MIGLTGRPVNVEFDVGIDFGSIAMPQNDTEQVIYRMTITVKGRVIRRANGQPFRIVLRKPKTK